MQRLEVSGAVRPLWWSLGVKGLMQLSNFIDVFLVRHVSGTYGHHQEH